MAQFTDGLNFVASAGVIIGQVFVLAIIALWLYVRFFPNGSVRDGAFDTLNWIGKRGLAIGFSVALVSVIVSLIYSDIIGYVPCKLCWIQRIFLYPQVIILGLALWKKTKDADLYCIALSVIGVVIAGYHFYGQSIDTSVLPACTASGGTSCAVRYFIEFGYVTIPMMAFTAFLLILTSVLLTRYAQK